jgi:hypothetical protein
VGLFGPSKKDILEEGRQAMATVRDISSTGVVVNGKPRIELTLEVVPMGQPTFTVEKKALLAPDETPRVGQQIPVRFLPEDRDRVEIDRAALEMSQAQIVTSPPGWGGEARAVDAGSAEGLREQMAKTLGAYGISMPDVPMPGLPPEIAGAGGGDDPVAKLEKLADLHKQGVLTDAEFQSAKAKVLGEL